MVKMGQERDGNEEISQYILILGKKPCGHNRFGKSSFYINSLIMLA